MQHLWCSDTSPLITEKEAVSCIIDVARRAEREMLCLHLPVLVFSHSHNLLTVSASVYFFKGLAANLVSWRVNEENVGKRRERETLPSPEVSLIWRTVNWLSLTDIPLPCLWTKGLIWHNWILLFTCLCHFKMSFHHQELFCWRYRKCLNARTISIQAFEGGRGRWSVLARGQKAPKSLAAAFAQPFCARCYRVCVVRCSPFKKRCSTKDEEFIRFISLSLPPPCSAPKHTHSHAVQQLYDGLRWRMDHWLKVQIHNPGARLHG